MRTSEENEKTKDKKRIKTIGKMLLYGTLLVPLPMLVFFENFYSIHMATGESMEPDYSGVSFVVCDHWNDNYSIGDVVWYKKDLTKACIYFTKDTGLQPNNNCIMHRIIKVFPSDQSFLVKGDNNRYPDGYVDLEQIQCKIVARII